MLLTRETFDRHEDVLPCAPELPRPRRVLLVAPHFAPVNAPDGQRARAMLPYLAENGWSAEVLTVRPEFVEAPMDLELAATLPTDLCVHRVIAFSPGATRAVGWSSLARRAYPFLKERGDELLTHGHFDLVFFTTCQFGVLALGPYWLARHGVPYVLDFHDEWAGDYYETHPRVHPPGGRLKYALSHAAARWQKKRVLQRAAQVVSVSPTYNLNLRTEIPDLDPARLHALPFGAAEMDFEILKRRRFPHDFFSIGAQTNWVYIGRGGATMCFAARAFFLALRQASNADLLPAELALHFIGTDYATGNLARPTFEPIARELDISVPIHEQTARVPHFTALQCLCDADAILIFGADDPGYNASKLLPSLHAHKPLLGIFHEESVCVRNLRETKGGIVIPFSSRETVETLADHIFENWFASEKFRVRPNTVARTLARFSAAAMTRELTMIFTSACPHPESRA